MKYDNYTDGDSFIPMYDCGLDGNNPPYSHQDFQGDWSDMDFYPH
eukprot:CAMPEP_0117046992 /NCGR_PEP_ID=MMETSP0472-20121206/32483_1 /TAXON_ID=693140 ORGANISM="Tiarina fusus, Strain LIS" /NCGR_SAMPLE_ID=MMETSP0472 /ASSEMBLY_ACC=CAM_ASM_000603 /LENGTH=44 /DNA_ID= /DNA_START= /DNA_END= /DNA_ORIENTATION=